MTSPPQATPRAPGSPLAGLLPLLTRLDHLLECATAAADLAFGPGAAADPHRGLHITDDEAYRLLSREPGAPSFLGYGDLPTEPATDLVPPGSRLQQLQQTFHLSPFDLDILIIALAPELDRRYERLYAYLQDDIRCRRPTVDLVFNLLCPTAADKLHRRAHFTPDAPLLRHGLLHLIVDPNFPDPTLLAHTLQLDQQVVRFLLHQSGLDPRLATFCQLHPAAIAKDSTSDLSPTLVAEATQHWQRGQPLRLYLQGSDHAAKRELAMFVAANLQAPLLTADLAALLDSKAAFRPQLQRLLREAWFHQALLYLDGMDALNTPEHECSLAQLQTLLAEAAGITLLSGSKAWTPAARAPLGIVTLNIPLPAYPQRRQLWQAHLQNTDLPWEESQLDALASRFRLTAQHIADAVLTAHQTARISGQPPDLFAAARAQTGHALSTLSRKIEPKYSWEDIVLLPNALAQLRDICNQARYQQQVYETWGFDRKLSLGKGLNVLFTGLPGTGKTMAAEILAQELQLDLYKIDLSQIVSKYIGETEKNLDRIFTAAANSNAILLFDEADALFGKRSEVRDAHDRYANIEVGYLLQKMEEYEGIAILTTNLRSNMDEAFIRRLRFIIEFPMPTPEQRLQIWQRALPDRTPRSQDIDFDILAEHLEISGASIRNIVLASAFLAANDGQVVTMAHLKQAVRREFQKMGKLLVQDLG